MRTSLDIVSVGMVTAVGLDAPSSCAAMRAGVDGFQETRFRYVGDEYVLGAPVPMPREWIGEKRMAHLAAAALSEAVAKVKLDRAPTLLLCLAEDNRPGKPISNIARFLTKVSDIVGFDAGSHCIVIKHGRPAGHIAIEKARAILASNSDECVIILGVDSYLTQFSIGHYLTRRRLLVPGNANGFIPGEAAAAIVCRASKSGRLVLAGVGLAQEKATIYGVEDLPFRGDGMTSAYDAALTEAGISMNNIGYRISDLIGEKYWFKQTALANLRLSRGPRDFIDLWSPGETLGNIGAAAVPVMIAMAWSAAEKGYGFGNSILLEASNDAGGCGAAVFLSRTG